MIFGTSSDSGAILIGLSRRNIELLLAGKPIHHPRRGTLPALTVVFGETEDALVATLTDAGVIAAELTNTKGST